MASPTVCDLKATRLYKYLLTRGGGDKTAPALTILKIMDNDKTLEINTENYKVINGDITEAQIAEWKGRYGRLVEIEVADIETEEQHRGYFHRPDMKTMQAFSATAKTNEIKAADVMFDNCWLGGSSMMKTDAVYKMQAFGALQNIFGRCFSKLKNL